MNKELRKELDEITSRERSIRNYRNPKGSKATELNDYRRQNARKVNKKKYPNSNIYVIQLDTIECYKIGVSQNTTRRFKDISGAMPFELKVIINERVDNAYDLEELFHGLFKDKHVKSEWFFLDEQDIEKIKSLI